MPGALAPPFYPFGCSRSHPANANGEEWGAGYSGREGACNGLLGLTRRSFWWEITQALSSLSMGAGGGDFLLLTSVKGEEGIIQSVALNSWVKNSVTVFLPTKSQLKRFSVCYHLPSRVNPDYTIYCKADGISLLSVALAYTCVISYVYLMDAIYLCMCVQMSCIHISVF